MINSRVTQPLWLRLCSAAAPVPYLDTVGVYVQQVPEWAPCLAFVRAGALPDTAAVSAFIPQIKRDGQNSQGEAGVCGGRCFPVHPWVEPDSLLWRHFMSLLTPGIISHLTTGEKVLALKGVLD